jgi:hypothetical protein
VDSFRAEWFSTERIVSASNFYVPHRLAIYLTRLLRVVRRAIVPTHQSAGYCVVLGSHCTRVQWCATFPIIIRRRVPELFQKRQFCDKPAVPWFRRTCRRAVRPPRILAPEYFGDGCVSSELSHAAPLALFEPLYGGQQPVLAGFASFEFQIDIG